ncbi:ATP-grasp domain-containing protein [Salisediminibacterium beveridgei]|uniref:Carbamoyl-phosphate synthase large chain n=1 Tax=Salisediminibacterium beveridgei TaxID=632773 RepID=A0A1D7QRN1_9BACI|nr:ATP-grasp domain-containing protein [Salisediminibacterium beveridgei]AOM81667.1 Carbamoyl-phosphate synthase large chain [Salisediminibacterium beveridgei]
MKKLLFLGGSIQQTPALKYAKKRGYYCILCDFLSDNPGRDYADEYHLVSTTDQEEVLRIAKQTKIDGIIAFASDPAAPTAAYVGNELNLPSNPYESVRILTKKDLFRKFLKKHGFNCPKAESFYYKEEAIRELEKLEFEYPLMVKPIDSSGSKGVNRINSINELDEAFELALVNSKEKIVIIEEFIEMGHKHMIGGDGFVINGELKFNGFLNCHRSKNLSPYVPIGKSYPLFLDNEKINLAKKEIEKVLRILGITMGALNLELMFDKRGRLYIIEIGPRNGGNMIPDLLEMITGVNLIAATVEAALGNEIKIIDDMPNESYYSIYVIHSAEKGNLVKLDLKQEIQKNIVKNIIYKEIGSKVDIFDGANKALGIIFLKFDNLEELQDKMDNMNNFVEVEVL